MSDPQSSEFEAPIDSERYLEERLNKFPTADLFKEKVRLVFDKDNKGQLRMHQETLASATRDVTVFFATAKTSLRVDRGGWREVHARIYAERAVDVEVLARATEAVQQDLIDHQAEYKEQQPTDTRPPALPGHIIMREMPGDEEDPLGGRFFISYEDRLKTYQNLSAGNPREAERFAASAEASMYPLVALNPRLPLADKTLSLAYENSRLAQQLVKESEGEYAELARVVDNPNAYDAYLLVDPDRFTNEQMRSAFESVRTTLLKLDNGEGQEYAKLAEYLGVAELYSRFQLMLKKQIESTKLREEFRNLSPAQTRSKITEIVIANAHNVRGIAQVLDTNALELLDDADNPPTAERVEAVVKQLTVQFHGVTSDRPEWQIVEGLKAAVRNSFLYLELMKEVSTTYPDIVYGLTRLKTQARVQMGRKIISNLIKKKGGKKA